MTLWITQQPTEISSQAAQRIETYRKSLKFLENEFKYKYARGIDIRTSPKHGVDGIE